MAATKAVTARQAPIEAAPPAPSRPAPGFDWVVAILSCWLVGGVFVDGWAHNHMASLETFFTPWHAVLYSGFAAVATPLAFAWLRGVRLRRPLWRSVPTGYELSALGVVLFGIGGLLDLLWHLRFGIEVSTEALLSPTHLLLVGSGVLIITGPLRAAWARPDIKLGWRSGGPAIAAVTLTLAGFGFFTQFAHPFVNPMASREQQADWGAASVYVIGSDGTRQTRLTGSGIWNPSWSPDGSQIAYHAVKGSSTQIWTMRADGTGNSQLTKDGGQHWGPAWSPDGGWIAYAGGPSTVQIWLVRPDGTGAHALTGGQRASLQPAWAPDSARLAFATQTPEGWRLATIAVDGSNGTLLPLAGTSPAYSPDGKFLAYTSAAAGAAQVWVAKVDGRDAHPVTAGRRPSTDPTWSPDGSRLAFTSEVGSGQHLFTARSDGSEPRDLTLGSGTWAAGRPVWSPDGSSLAFAAGGYPAVNPDLAVALGVASILLQAALLTGALLLLLSRWRPPVGAVATLIAAPVAMIAFMKDSYTLIPIALAVGGVVDLMVWRLRPGSDRPWALRLTAFVVPTALYLAYFGTLAATQGIAWSIHVWAGAAMMAGLVGLLLSLLVVRPGAGPAPGD